MTRLLPLAFLCALAAGCSDSGTDLVRAAPEANPSSVVPDAERDPTAPDPFEPLDEAPAPEASPPDRPVDEPRVDEPTDEPADEPSEEPVEKPVDDVSPIAEPADLYERDGYGTVDVLRIDVRTVTTPGTCTVEDPSGCTLADVIADTDPKDELKVDIPVHVTMADFPDDGRTTNAEMRQRGASARLSSRKSFRVELKGKGVRWRGEDKLQINKHPYDPSLIRNKLAFDLMARIPNLPSSRTQFVNLWIDDGEGPVDHGVFTHDEAAGDEYFENRGWDKDGNLYKAEKFLFALQDLEYLAIDEEGEPLDENRFEQRLEIQHGEDHRALHRMIETLNDRETPFEEVMARHFDEENVLTYVAVNILLRQPDATTHNFYLYNPAGTEKFFYVPWDYDYAFGVEAAPEESFDTDALAYRLFYGFGKITASNFLKALYTQPGFHEKVLAKADELRDTVLTDATISELASRYTDVVAPVAARGPERYKHKPEQAAEFDDHVATNHADLVAGYLPFSPSLSEPKVEEDTVRFSWSDAHDVAGRALTYDLEVSTSATFEPGDRVLFEGGIPDEGERIRLEVPLDDIGSGERYVRLIARVADDPGRLWQIAGNRETIDGEPRIGVRRFVVP